MTDKKYCIWIVRLKDGSNIIYPAYPACRECCIWVRLDAEDYKISDILAIEPYIEQHTAADRSR